MNIILLSHLIALEIVSFRGSITGLHPVTKVVVIHSFAVEAFVAWSFASRNDFIPAFVADPSRFIRGMLLLASAKSPNVAKATWDSS